MQNNPDQDLQSRLDVDRGLIRTVIGNSRTVFIAVIAAGIFGALLGLAADTINESEMPLWLVGRSAGLAAYLLLTYVVMAGMVLSHRKRARYRPTPGRIRLHVGLVTFTLAFTFLHIFVLAIDPYAQVGWLGVLLPMGAGYRPVPVTLGVLAMWSGLVSGLSASLAGRGTGKVWLKLHRAAALAWVLAWLHGVLTGIDTPLLLPMYIVTGFAVMGVGIWRYLSREKVVIRAQENRTAVRIR